MPSKTMEMGWGRGGMQGAIARMPPLSGGPQPQQSFSASSELIDSIPSTGLSVTSITPVL